MDRNCCSEFLKTVEMIIKNNYQGEHSCYKANIYQSLNFISSKICVFFLYYNYIGLLIFLKYKL